MGLIYNIFGKEQYKNKTVEGEVVSYKLTPEEIEKLYDNTMKPIERLYTIGYNKEVDKKYRRMKNQIGRNITKEYWNVPVNRMYK
jgi:hypothetical protein